jgi:hypothetical protein
MEQIAEEVTITLQARTRISKRIPKEKPVRRPKTLKLQPGVKLREILALSQRSLKNLKPQTKISLVVLADGPASNLRTYLTNPGSKAPTKNRIANSRLTETQTVARQQPIARAIPAKRHR